jgi:hypothetical protein
VVMAELVPASRSLVLGDSIFSVQWLSSDHNCGYGPLPIPQERDELITKLIRAWMSLDDASRKESVCEITERQVPVLLAYSERMASLAVRENNGDLLVLGLIAIGLDGWRYDWRENLIILALHYDAAKRLGISPEIIFGKAFAFLSERFVDALAVFLRRRTRDKSLEAMGYIAGADDQGFRYMRTW